jgi:predicted nucleotidyltransferase component of viral defense system
MLNKKDLRDLIETTLLNIKLTGAVIEKDYYVTQVIHALSDIQNEYFRLVFAGGTCLAHNCLSHVRRYRFQNSNKK